MENHSTRSLVKRAILEARIVDWFKRPRRRLAAPELLSKLTKPKRGMHLRLAQRERVEFTRLIRRINKARRVMQRYRVRYGRCPRAFYTRVFGFPPRCGQSVRVVWSTFNIHFIFERNDLMAFWRRVQWGPGVGGYYSVGDRDVKIQELRGLVSFGRVEDYGPATSETIRHESVHAFEEYVKGRKPPAGAKRRLYYSIKSELNAYLHNFRESRGKKKRRMNEGGRRGLSLEVRERVEEHLSYRATVEGIGRLERKRRRAKTKKEKGELTRRLMSLRLRLRRKRGRIRAVMSLHRRTVNQVKKAVDAMPVSVLRRVIYETPYERLHRKIPQAVMEYRRMRYEWYRDN
jgi:hypothetical protein